MHNRPRGQPWNWKAPRWAHLNTNEGVLGHLKHQRKPQWESKMCFHSENEVRVILSYSRNRNNFITTWHLKIPVIKWSHSNHCFIKFNTSSQSSKMSNLFNSWCRCIPDLLWCSRKQIWEKFSMYSTYDTCVIVSFRKPKRLTFHRCGRWSLHKK